MANAATHMGMEVYGYDPYISVNAAWSLSRSVKHISNVEDIYRECDFITIHVPLLDSTKKMINAEAIAMMKPTAIVLNFARDLLVDEEAMVDALAAGKIRKYVSDFPNTTTVGAKGCIVTPHLGASTEESEDNCAIMAVREIRDYLENGNIVHSVNFPDCNMGACMTAGRIGILHRNEKGIIAKYTHSKCPELGETHRQPCLIQRGSVLYARPAPRMCLRQELGMGLQPKASPAS